MHVVQKRSLGALLALSLAAPGCREKREPLAPLARDLLAFAAEASHQLGLPPVEGDPRRALGDLVERARPERARAGKPGEPDPIARILLDERTGIRPDPDDATIGRALLPQVLGLRRGSCLGLSAVYLAVAEELGVDARGALAPGHFLVRRRLPGGEVRNLELLEGGRPLTLEELRRRHSVPPRNPLYLRSLSAAETVAAFRYNLANELRGRRRLREAVRQYLAVLEQLPDLAEAHLNLGLCYYWLGEHARAERAYLRASALSPGLRGLRGNLDALHRVWRGRDAGSPP